MHYQTAGSTLLRQCELSSRKTCLLDQIHGDDAVDDTQHLARDQRATDEEKTQLERERISFSIQAVATPALAMFNTKILST